MDTIGSHPRYVELLLLITRSLLLLLGGIGLVAWRRHITGPILIGYLLFGLVTVLIYWRLRATWPRQRDQASRLWWLAYAIDLLVVAAVTAGGGLAGEAYHLYPLISIQTSLIHGPLAGLLVSATAVLTYLQGEGALTSLAIEGATAVRAVYLLVLGALTSLLANRERQLRAWAMIDFKTRIPNFRAFHHRLIQSLSQARTAGQPLAVAVLDVDHFKRINAAVGHPNADAILEQVAKQLESRLRPGEYLARYGGEEFTLLMRGANANRALNRADQLRRAIAQHPFPYPGGAAPVRVTVSVGVAAFPTHGHTARSLLVAADQALLAAKESGRNRAFLAGAAVVESDAAPPLTRQRRPRDGSGA